MIRNDIHEANRLSWNAATQAHNSHKANQAAFLRAGGSRSRTPPGVPDLPLLYGIAAEKEG